MATFTGQKLVMYNVAVHAIRESNLLGVVSILSVVSILMDAKCLMVSAKVWAISR